MILLHASKVGGSSHSIKVGMTIMSYHARAFLRRIHPALNRLQLAELHASANSIVSRKASGESSFSANSRWHSRTNFKASRRFALASSMVSPCEIAAGISSTKQVYPPSLAGSKTAVSFMLINYHASIAFEQATTLS